MTDPMPGGCRASRRCPIADDPCGPGGARPYCWETEPTPGEDVRQTIDEMATHVGKRVRVVLCADELPLCNALARIVDEMESVDG